MSQHDPTVFILGAGFSAPAGHPLMAEFAKVVTGLATDPDTPLLEEERARFRKVLGYRSALQKLYAYSNLDVDNLEHLFGLIDLDATLLPASSAGDEMRNDLIFVLVKTLELTLRVEPNLEKEIRECTTDGDRTNTRILRQDSRHSLANYVGFVDALRPHDVILTFNYDTVLEDALLAAAIGPDYGFAPPPWPEVERTQSVLKLHGSVNFVDAGERGVEIVDHELVERRTERYYQQGNPLLVPPTWNKPSPSGVIQEIWTQAWRAVSKASRLVFIGYSLPETDLSFRYLMAHGLAGNEVLQSVSVLDPAPETRDRYAKLVSEALRNQHKFHAVPNVFQHAWREVVSR